MRLIDADALIARYDEEHKGSPGRARELITEAPTIEAEPVVRCKDCIHRVKGAKMCMHPKAIGWDAIEPDDGDFCSYGERSKNTDD